jgi:hypothetical protein
MDADLRQAEITYHASPTDENLERLNRKRIRAGLEFLSVCKTCKNLELQGPECDFCNESLDQCQDCAKQAGPLTPGTIPGQYLYDDPHYACDRCGHCMDCQIRVCLECDNARCTMCDTGPLCQECRSWAYGLCPTCEQEDDDEQDEGNHSRYRRNPTSFLIIWPEEYDDFESLGINALAQSRLGILTELKSDFEEEYSIQDDMSYLRSEIEKSQRRISQYRDPTPALRRKIKEDSRALQDLVPPSLLEQVFVERKIDELQKKIDKLVSEQRLLLDKDKNLTRTLIFDSYAKAVDHIVRNTDVSNKLALSNTDPILPDEICGYVVETETDYIPPENIVNSQSPSGRHILGFIPEDALSDTFPVYFRNRSNPDAGDEHLRRLERQARMGGPDENLRYRVENYRRTENWPPHCKSCRFLETRDGKTYYHCTKHHERGHMIVFLGPHPDDRFVSDVGILQDWGPGHIMTDTLHTAERHNVYGYGEM